MSYEEEYFCPNCNAVLNNQTGFDPDLGAWTCTECGQTLYGDDVESTMAQFDGVVWYCDSCGAVLNKQSGFDDSCGTWYCTNCGHANPINESEIYESEAEYQSSRKTYSCPSCGSTLNDQNWFDENDDTYTCSWCDTELFKDGDEYRILFKCPHCGSELKDQWGFDEDDYWTCRQCDTRLYKESDSYLEADSDSSDDSDDEDDQSSNSSSNYSYSSSASNPSSTTTRPTATSPGRSSKKAKKSNWKAKFIITLVLILAATIGLSYYEYTKLIPVQYSSEALPGQDYETVVNNLKQAGFSFVNTNCISDLSVQDFASENQVTEVKIGWISSFQLTSRIPSNFPVVVTYHTLERIAVPMSSKEAKGKNYEEVIKEFNEAGFVNIEVEIEYDIITGWLTDDGEVESVMIGDSKKFSSDARFRPDETVVITYHTLKKNKPN